MLVRRLAGDAVHPIYCRPVPPTPEEDLHLGS